ncbi:DNA topoisomerase VI subunit B [Candidatus Micrarchaeota archaeon]|nr:DNA topoisomerase VI subunit B [Candidatus Micrarchaeota archaeon]
MANATNEDIFKQFKEHSVAEFFKKNRQMLGFSGKVRSMTIIIHEFVTNSLDAAEEAGILPEIFVQIEVLDKEGDHYRITVKDNGPGIPKTHLGKALGQMLAGTKFHRYVQQRGQQGIGAAACTMFSYLTTGQKTRAVSCHKGKKLTADISLDFKTNRPIVEEVSEEDTTESGLMVVAEYKDVRYERSDYGVYEYLRRTALANPHTSITLVEPNTEKSVFPRSVEMNPKRPTEIKPHPLGISTHDLLEFAKHNSEYKKLSLFLINTFSRFSSGKVDELRAILPGFNFDKNPSDLEWHEAEQLVKAFAGVKWIAPATDSLVPIGKDQVELSFKNIFNPELVIITERPPKVYRGGIPFMVEAGIAYGGGLINAQKKGDVMRFANRVPLLFDSSGCAITNMIKSIDWKRYDVRAFEEEPIAVLVNVVSVHVPYTSAGKQAISSEEDLEIEIKNAVMEAARSIQRYLSGKRKASDLANKKKLVSRYVSQLSGDLSSLSGEKREKIEKTLRYIIETKYSSEMGVDDEEAKDIKAAEKAKKEEAESEGDSDE